MSSSWWDTTGATAAITGVATVAGVAVGLLLRPWVDGRIRRREHAEITTKEARELVADLTGLLWGGFSGGFTLEIAEADAGKWAGELRRRTLLLSKFGPSDVIRKATSEVWRRFERLASTALAAKRTGKAETMKRREVLYGEASYALDLLTESLGGPKAPPRDSYPLLLREDTEG